MESTKKFYGSRAAFGAFLIIFVNLGLCTCLGVFLASIADYIGWPIGTVAILGTINTIANAALSLVAIKLVQKIGSRWTMLISIIACAAHVTLYTLTSPGQNLGSLIMCYVAGFLASVAIAFGTHAVCSSLVAEWYVSTHKREKMTSIVTSGAAFGAAIWVFISGQLAARFSFQTCYHILAVAALVIGLVAVIFLIRTPKEVGQEPDGLEELKKEQAGAKDIKLPGMSYKEALKSPSFWLLSIGCVLAIMGASGFISYNAAYWQGMGMSVTTSATWNAVWLLASAVVMLFAGNLFKKIGSTGFTIYVAISFALAFIFMMVWGAQPTTIMMILIVIFGALGYPLCAAFPSLAAHGVFGPKEIAKIITTFMVAVYIGQLLGPVTFSALVAHGWTLLWTIWTVCTLVGAVVIVIAINISPYVREERAKKKLEK